MIKSDISDHLPIIFTIQIAKIQGTCQNLVYNKREFNKANKAAFKQQLSLLHWRHISSEKDVNKMYETFLSTFLKQINKKSLHSAEQIANEFNSFFTNVGPSHGKNIPPVSTSFT